MSTPGENAVPILKTRQVNPPRPAHPFIKLCMGQARVVLRQKGNNNTIGGRCKWYRNGFLKLTDATIEFGGREQTERIEVPWVLVETQTIAYLRPDADDMPF